MTESLTTQATTNDSALAGWFLPCPKKGQHERLTDCWVCWSDEMQEQARQEQAADATAEQEETAPTPPAMRTDMVLSYVRELAEQLTGIRPTESPSGDPAVAIVVERNLVILEVLNPPDPFIQITAVHDVPSPHLYRVAEDLNQGIHFARAIVSDQALLVHCEIWACDLTPLNFRHACRNVAQVLTSGQARLVELDDAGKAVEVNGESFPGLYM